jgi:crotonobetainyl-CoA:carnitine CoA-transferase CaiB-like acyl-CoA transferase
VGKKGAVSEKAETRPFAVAAPSKAKPLTGVRIIDAGNMVAAPFAAVLLADMGADVI